MNNQFLLFLIIHIIHNPQIFLLSGGDFQIKKVSLKAPIYKEDLCGYQKSYNFVNTPKGSK